MRLEVCYGLNAAPVVHAGQMAICGNGLHPAVDLSEPYGYGYGAMLQFKKYNKLIEALSEGRTLRDAAAIAGCAVDTAMKYRKTMLSTGDPRITLKITPKAGNKRFYPKGRKGGGGNFLKPAKVALIIGSLSAGQSIRVTAKIAGCDKHTVQRYCKMLLAANPNARGMCACGKPNSHKEWCKVRYAKSPARQAFMKRWNKR